MGRSVWHLPDRVELPARNALQSVLCSPRDGLDSQRIQGRVIEQGLQLELLALPDQGQSSPLCLYSLPGVLHTSSAQLASQGPV